MEYEDCYIFDVNTKSRPMRLKLISVDNPVFVQKNILDGIILCYSRNDQFSYNCLINYVPSINNRPLVLSKMVHLQSILLCYNTFCYDTTIVLM